MRTIPENKIIQSKGLGDTIGDIVESFNLDLSANYGAIRTTKMKNGSTDGGVLDLPIAFQRFEDYYYMLCNDYVYKGGQRPSVLFEDNYNESGISSANSDMKVFNSCLYITTGDEVHKLSSGTWSDAVTAGLTSSPHLLEVFGDRLYITEGNTKVLSISTSDVLATSGAYTLDTGLDSNWNITMLKTVGDLIYIGLMNSDSGLGMVLSWDGATENTTYARYDLPSGVVAGTVLDNIPYIIDTQGTLKKYAGNTFKEEAKFFKNNGNIFKSALSTSNTRFIHPNGMTVTDDGNILILMSNEIENIGYEDSVPSGVWEYNPNIGLYHKYSISVTDSDYGQVRLVSTGAIYADKPNVPSTTENGLLLCGAKYFTDASASTVGVFYDDTFDTSDKFSHFITTWKMSEINDVWNKIYLIYKKLKNSISKFVVKYRTEEDTPTTATISWVDIDRFTTTTDVSDYVYGDEVIILQGAGSGMSSHITSITEDGGTYTVILDENYPTTVWGKTGKANFSKWKKAGTAEYSEERQIKSFSLSFNNNQPFAQFKICIKANGKEELYKLKIINKNSIKE